MPQVKIYGLKDELRKKQHALSDIVHSSISEALGVSSEKRFHRFFPMDRSTFLFGPERSNDYTIIEIMLFEGRTVQMKNSLIKLIYERIRKNLNVKPDDVEIILIEIPKANWGLRGMTGIERDEELHSH